MDFRVLLCAMLALNSAIANSTAEQAGSKLPGGELKNLSSEHTSSRREKRGSIASEERFLIYSDGYAIFQSSLDGSRSQVLVTDNFPKAIDYDYRSNTLYWGEDNSGGSIKQSNLDGSDVVTLLEGLRPGRLAVDWMNNKIYFTHRSSHVHNNNILSVLDPVNFYYKVLVNITGYPISVVLDPISRLMFWSEYEYEDYSFQEYIYSIQRASMDGSNRITLYSTNNIPYSVGLALDIQSQILYWSNGYGQLESSNLDGTNRQIIVAESVSIRRNLLAVLEANVFYYIDSYLKRINITDGASTTTLGRIPCNADGFQIVDQFKQPVVYNPCSSGNGGCSHLCLLSTASRGFTCACPDGMILDGDSNCVPTGNSVPVLQPQPIIPGSCVQAGHTTCCDNSTCEGSPANCYCDANCHLFQDCCIDVPAECSQQDFTPYIVSTDYLHIFVSDVKSKARKRTIYTAIFNPSLHHIDYHYRMNALFWTGYFNSSYSIWRANLDGSNAEPIFMFVGIKYDRVDIAVDWITDKIYWSDTHQQTINVLDIHSRYNRVLLYTTREPANILVDPSTRYIYWTECSREFNGTHSMNIRWIFRVSPDGRNIQILRKVSVNFTCKYSIRISIDYENQLLYLLSIKGIEVMSINGSDQRRQLIRHFYYNRRTYFSFLNGKTFYYWLRKDLYSVDISISNSKSKLLYSIYSCNNIIDSKIIAQQQQYENPCGLNNGGCSDLCLLSAVDARNYTCACHFNTTLLPNMLDCLENATIEPIITPGSCLAAGFTSCCSGNDCRGSPPTCHCDKTCTHYEDCCHDVFSCDDDTLPTPVLIEALEIVNTPENSLAVQNTTVIFRCEVTSTSVPNIEWWFTPAGSQQLQMVADKQRSRLPDYLVIPSAQHLTLVIQNVQYIHHGTYTCIVSAGDVNATASATLNVILPLSSLSLSDNGESIIEESSVLTLTCTMQANPAPVITWLKRSDGGVTVILNSARISITTQHRVDDATSTSILTINRAEPGDQGDYVCEASNALTMEVSMVNVSVQIEARDDCVGAPTCLHGGVCIDLIGDTACMCDHTGHTGEHCEIEVSDMQPPPVIEEPPANTNASLIGSINLTCTAEGSAPNYQWLKDGVPIAGETRSYLYIEETVPEDRGNYTCVAINGGGRDESEPARLKIPGIYQYGVTLQLNHRTELNDVV